MKVNLRKASKERNALVSLLFDEHAEEIPFLQIYLHEYITLCDNLIVTSLMLVTSEFRISVRQGVLFLSICCTFPWK